MSSHYQRFVRVLEQWPVDKSKAGRDFGEEIRKLSKTIINTASLTAEEDLHISKQIDALERLAKSIYKKKYPRLLNSTATGLSSDQCSNVLSSEFLQYLNQK